MKPQRKSEKIIDVIGGHGLYQILLLINFIFLTFAMDFNYGIIGFITSPPIISYLDSQNQVKEDSADEIKCKTFINIVKYTNNWLIEFEIYCDSFKISFIQALFLAGAAIGLVLLKILTMKFYKENLIKVMQTINLLSFLLLLVKKNYWVICFFTFINGVAFVPSYILKNVIITEYVGKERRSIFQLIGFMASASVAVIIILLYELIEHGDWRNIYYGIGLYLIIPLTVMIFLLKINPRNYILKRDFENAYTNALFIAKLNGKIVNTASTLYSENAEKNLIDLDEINETYTEKELKDWIFNYYEVNNDDELKLPDPATISQESAFESEINEKNMNAQEIENTDKPHNFLAEVFKKFITKKYILLLLIVLSSNFVFTTSLLENGKFVIQPDFKLAFLVITGCIYVSFFLSSFLMNIKFLGRKYTNIIFVLICLTLRIISSQINPPNVWICLLIFLFSFTINSSLLLFVKPQVRQILGLS